MGLLSSVWALITKIFKAIFKWLGDILGEWFLILLIIVVIWFAPVIAAWLVTAGAPAFVVTIFETLALATPYLQTAAAWLWDGGSSLVSSAWSAFRGMDAGTQAAMTLGAAAMIAPEETEAVISDAFDLLATGTEAIVGGFLSNPTGLIIGGLAVWWLFFRDKKDVVVLQPGVNDA